MARFAMLVALSGVSMVAPAVALPPPPAARSWVRVAWVCPGKERSSIEIEQLAQGDAGYQTKVLNLVVAGKDINPQEVSGLPQLMARRNFLRIVGGYCDRRYEMIGIEEGASGPKAAEAGWRSFTILYPAQP